MKKLFLISFDICSDKIRRRVVKLLLANCIRVQKSVFEGLLNDKEFIELKKKLDDKIDYTTDSIRYYHICRNCIENILISGQGLYTVEEDVIVV